MLTTAFIYMPIVKKRGKPIIAHARSSSEDSILKIILARLSKFHTSEFLAVSELAAKNVFGKKNTKKNVKIIPNGFNLAPFLFSNEKRNKLRIELNVEKKFVIGHVGRFHKVKNHKFLIEVFRNFRKTNSKAHLILVGDGPERRKIEEFINKNHLASYVSLIGIKSNIHEIYNTFDYFLFPSIFEGFPGALIEAQLSGLDCMASDSLTKQAEITNKIKWLNLKLGASKWASQISQSLSRRDRFKVSLDAINSNKYNIDSVTSIYKDLYIKLISTK
jgi:glycosyltransferase involved in cell wall biosynthesis